MPTLDHVPWNGVKSRIWFEQGIQDMTEVFKALRWDVKIELFPGCKPLKSVELP